MREREIEIRKRELRATRRGYAYAESTTLLLSNDDDDDVDSVAPDWKEMDATRV